MAYYDTVHDCRTVHYVTVIVLYYVMFMLHAAVRGGRRPGQADEYVYIYTHTCMYLHTYMCVYMIMHISVCVYIYIYIYTHIHVYTCI